MLRESATSKEKMAELWDGSKAPVAFVAFMYRTHGASVLTGYLHT